MKRIILLLTTILLCTGCANPDSPILSTAISSISGNAGGHMEQLQEYDSPYTICYKNTDDTYTMYIFASPVQYKTDAGKYAVIDNTVTATEKEGFAFENKANTVKTYFPQTLSDFFLIEKDTDAFAFKPAWDTEGFSNGEQTVFTNMYNDQVSGVLYRRGDMDLLFYPTKAGIKMEIIWKEKPDTSIFSFDVQSTASTYVNKQNGYILFQNEGELQSIIYRPLVQYTADKHTQYDITAQMKIEKGNDYHVQMIPDASITGSEKTAYPIKIDLAFEMYLNKMPDSTVYSRFAVNNYLANYAVIGEHPVLGEGRHYLRFRLNHFMTQPPKNLLSAKYKIRKLYSKNSDVDIVLRQPANQWSSTGMIWSNKMEEKEFSYDTSYSFTPDDWCSIDITAFARECLSDQSLLSESVGIVLSMQKQKAENYMIFATSDHALYTPYLELVFSELPLEFNNVDQIN